jgi:ABC-type arginine/histidine transport system permease subunit
MENATAVLIATFLLVAKVHSPQYALWLLPFYVIVRRTPLLMASWAIYVVADAVVFVSVFRRIAQFSGFTDDATSWELLLKLGVLVRAIALVLAVAGFLAAARGPSEPPVGADPDQAWQPGRCEPAGGDGGARVLG